MRSSSFEGLPLAFRRLLLRTPLSVALHRFLLPDLDEKNLLIWRRVRPFTMTGPERVNALVDAVRYLVAHRIEGAFVECGVWKGGSTMAMALALTDCGEQERDIYLFDTFEGMTRPEKADEALHGQPASRVFTRKRTSDDASSWCRSGIEETSRNLATTGYPMQRLHFVPGKVEETLPEAAPDRIALLRLDTDWYSSTRHELEHLYPRLVSGGVLFVDDYGHWKGARKAVDEFLASTSARLLLHRVDYTGRSAVKP